MPGCLRISLALHAGPGGPAGGREQNLGAGVCFVPLILSKIVNAFAGASWLIRAEQLSRQPPQPSVSMATTGPRKTKKHIGVLQEHQLPLHRMPKKEKIYMERKHGRVFSSGC